MNSPLVDVVDRHLGEFRDGDVLRRVFVVDILACGHEVWHDVGVARDPYSITARRRCGECASGGGGMRRNAGYILK